MIIWLFGLSGCGKSTLAQSLPSFYVLDGDDIRNGLCKDLGFSLPDRTENLRRVAEVAKILDKAGVNVAAAFITPLVEQRDMVRSIIPDVKLIQADCSLEACIERDVKGLYAKAISGEIKDFTGISSPFEQGDEIKVDTEQPLEGSAAELWRIVYS